MNTERIDILNLGLIALSLLMAIIIPFKLFIFSYAILGPLHYLTEINWLKHKNYFIRPKREWITILITFAVLASIYPVFSFINFSLNNSFEGTLNFIASQRKVIILTAFLFSVSLIFVKNTSHILLSLLLSFLISISLNSFIPRPIIILGAFLPTLIHVYLFTLLFIIYGAIKSKSKFGIYNALVMISILMIILLININPLEYQISQETSATFISSRMNNLSLLIAQMLGKMQNGEFYLLSEFGIRIQIFIAFAYTYHYLNWFSKTSIIGWKKALSKNSTTTIIFIWLISMAIYSYDYETGVIVLFFLSFLHVFLEFPLNVITIKELALLAKIKK